jgi:Arc/MetJ-type ribon-helix-helix transcriptional regulator
MRQMRKKEQFRSIRLSADLDQQIEKEARQRGFASASAFIRAAIESELKGHGQENLQLEQRVAASFDRVVRELRRLGNAQQALFAFTDALARTLLHSIPEVPIESRESALAQAKQRHHRLLKMAALSMQGDARAAMLELTDSIEP